MPPVNSGGVLCVFLLEYRKVLEVYNLIFAGYNS